MKQVNKLIYFFSKAIKLNSITEIEKNIISKKEVKFIKILTKNNKFLKITLIDNVIDFIFIKNISLMASKVLFNKYYNMLDLYGYKHMLIKCKTL